MIKQYISIFIILIDKFFINIPFKSKKNFDICCVKVDLLGDYIIWLEFGNSVKYKFKKKILICNYQVYELAKKLNQFDELIPINIKKFKTNLIYRIKIIFKLKSLKVSLSIHNTYSRDTLSGDTIIRTIPSKKKLGYYGDFKNQSSLLKLISNNWYSKLLKIDGTKMHESEINSYLLKYLNIRPRNFIMPKLSNLSKFDYDFSRKFIVISPGASNHDRAWAHENFIKLIKYILKKYDLDIVLCGSKFDKKITNIISRSFRNHRIIDFCGYTNIEELVEIIKKSRLVIANDSSSVHIANILNTKSICLCGGNNFGRFVPYPEKTNAEYLPETIFSKDCFENKWLCSNNKYHRCIDMIKVNQVISALKKIEFY